MMLMQRNSSMQQMNNIDSFRKDSSTPFPHIIIDDFFDEDYYRKLLSVIHEDTSEPLHLPDEPCYPDQQHIVDIKTITQNSSFWEDFIKKMSSEIMLQYVTDTMDLEGSINSIAYTIHKDKKGFSRGEHDDIKSWNKEMVSLQIYCPTNNDLEHTGTWLGTAGEDTTHIDFIPNRAWMFKSKVGLNSNHYVKRIQEDTTDRNSIIMKYCVQK